MQLLRVLKVQALLMGLLTVTIKNVACLPTLSIFLITFFFLLSTSLCIFPDITLMFVRGYSISVHGFGARIQSDLIMTPMHNSFVSLSDSFQNEATAS